MIALVCFVLAVLSSPFKSKSRLEAENAALRHQLVVLRRKLKGGSRLLPVILSISRRRLINVRIMIRSVRDAIH
jgi:hypothetical protein